MSRKAPEAFRTIAEAAAEVGVAAHVLRFWETRFAFIQPLKRAGGRRFYRPSDIALLRDLRRLLHDDGLSIKAVQALPERRWRAVATGTPPAHSGKRTPSGPMELLRAALLRATHAKQALDALLGSSTA